MKLSEVLSEDLVLMNLKGRTKKALLGEMVRYLVRAGRAKEETALRDAVFQREVLHSTGIGRGIAVPHAVTREVEGLTCVMGISRRGIKYGAIDKQPVHFVFLFINNKTRDVRYLTLLAWVCRLFESSAFRSQVMSAKNVHEVLEMIREGEGKSKSATSKPDGPLYSRKLSPEP